jgi:uncharacterized ubiquitin-like protein YukD
MNQLCRYSYPFPHYNPCPRPTFNTCTLAPNDEREPFNYVERDVYLKTITNRTISIPFDSNLTILDIKKMLWTNEGVRVDQSRLVHKGRILMNELTLGDYNIRPGDIIWLILRLDGE